MVLCIDLGLWKLGVAYYSEEGELLTAKTIKRDDSQSRRGAPAWVAMSVLPELPIEGSVVIESMQIDRRSRRAATDLLELSAIGGAILAIAHDRGLQTYSYKPKVWKGNTPKDITTARAKEKLSPEELSRVADNFHDTWDAIALGLFHLKREGIL